MSDQIDEYLGRLVRDQRLATSQQLELCTAEQARRIGEGRPIRLGALMVELGMLSVQQASNLLVQMNERELLCSACGKSHIVIGPSTTQQLACQVCDNPLSEPTASPRAAVEAGPDLGATLLDMQHRKAESLPYDQTIAAPPPPTPPGMEPTPLQLFSEGSTTDRMTTRDPLIGRHLSGKYEILEQIGRGGMGAVYRARHTKLDRMCAVKVLPLELSGNPDLLERFRREARATAKLDQNQVVTIYDVDTDGPTEYLAMEFLEGDSLETLVQKKGKLRVKTSLQIIRQATMGLAAAHEHGIIHRDVKPANLMLTKDGVVKVMDFGLARLVEISSGLSQAGQVLGTPHYMSPEQARGEPLDLRSDIYSLGATLFFLLTGQTPHKTGTPTAILLKVVSEEPPQSDLVEPSIPKSVSDLALRMMAREPQERFGDCKELLRAIEQLLPQSSGVGPPPGDRPTPLPAITHKQMLMTGGGIAGGVLILIMAILLFSKSGADPDGDALEEQRAAASQAYQKLIAGLARQTVGPDEKRRACESYLDKHPESAESRKVKNLLKEWQLAAEQEQWSKRLAALSIKARRLTEQGKSAEARRLIQAFIEQQPREPSATQAARLLASLGAPVREEKDSTTLSRLRRTVTTLLAEDRHAAAVRQLSLYIARSPKDQKRAEALLDRVEKQASQRIEALRKMFERQIGLDDHRGATRSYNQLQQVGAKNLRRYQNWLRANGPQTPPVSSKHTQLDSLMDSIRSNRIRAVLLWIRGRDKRPRPGWPPSGQLAPLARSIAERLSLALVTAEPSAALEQVRGLVTRRNPIGLLVGAVCEARMGNSDKGREYARQAFLEGMPISERALVELRLIPQFGDTVRMKDGTVYRGILKSKDGTQITFVYSEGQAQRFKFLKLADVRSVERNTPDSKLIARINAGSDILAQLGLAGWLAINKRHSEAKALRQAVNRRLATLRSKQACKTCASEPLPTPCSRCKGSGTISRRPCQKCGGKGKVPCKKCGGDGKRLCSTCGGKGRLPPRRRPPQRGGECHDCRGRKVKLCNDCDRGKRPCNSCWGKKLPAKKTCPDCQGHKPKTCADCGGSKIILDSWTVLALAQFHSFLKDKNTADQHWQRLANPRNLPRGWQPYFANRMREMGAGRYAQKLEGG